MSEYEGVVSVDSGTVARSFARLSPCWCLYLPICPLCLKLINTVVLLILLTALSDPDQYHLTSAELANDLDVMDDASKWARRAADQSGGGGER